jgi:hypothetical protein
MRARSPRLAALTTVIYLMAVCGSALFHEHHDRPGSGEDPARQGVSASCSDDDHECSICQFLAQKPAPAAVIAPVDLSSLVQDVAAPTAVRAAPAVFTAWHSRAPPASA